jgi:hypothetical protein
LGYKPSYSLATLLSELAAYGDRGPPQLTRVKRQLKPRPTSNVDSMIRHDHQLAVLRASDIGARSVTR